MVFIVRFQYMVVGEGMIKNTLENNPRRRAVPAFRKNYIDGVVEQRYSCIGELSNSEILI